MEAVLSWVPRSRAQGWGLEVTAPSKIAEGNGNPLHYSCLENPRDGGAWWAAVYGVLPRGPWSVTCTPLVGSFRRQVGGVGLPASSLP